MAITHVAYDTRSGCIVSVHHGEADQSRARERAQHHAKIAAEHIAVIQVASEAMARGKSYKVDLGRKVLVEAASGGSSFSAGKIARTF